MSINLFGRRRAPQQKVITGRFEIEQDGQIAYLDYTVAGNILALLHAEVPKNLRHRGLASELAKSALQWACDHNMKVDVMCPVASAYLDGHKEYADL